jgi:nucleoside-diphosphate-sugar epimerase
MLKVAVTGASGFIGKELCARLSITSDVQLTQIDRRNSVNSLDHINLEQVADSDLIKYLSKYDCLIHLAARAHTKNATIDDFKRDNTELSERIANVAVRANIKHFIYLSSIKVLGDNTEPGVQFTHNSKPCPSDIYGQSKWASEIVIANSLKNSPTVLTIVRPPLVWGPNCKGNLKTLINLINKGIPIPVAGIKNRRDIVSLDNLCNFIKHLITHHNTVNSTFLVSDGKARSTEDIVHLLERFAFKEAKLIRIPNFTFTLLKLYPRFRNKISSFCGNLEVDITETQRQLDWTPNN